jgi:hypothetical protein
MTYRFIDQYKDQWPVRWLCQTLEVSAAGYYAWRRSPRSAQEQRRDALLVEIRAVHAQFKARHGSPRIHAELVAHGHGGDLRVHRGLLQCPTSSLLVGVRFPSGVRTGGITINPVSTFRGELQ